MFQTNVEHLRKPYIIKKIIFWKKNDFEQFEDLLELYYEVKLEESAKGLLEEIINSMDINKKMNNVLKNSIIISGIII